MSDLVIEVSRRERTGKNESRRLRAKGHVPAVLYGEGKEPVPVAVEMRALYLILHSEKGVNTVFDVALSGTDRRRSVMVKDFQLDPVTDRLIHADFVRISADREVHVPVEIELEGVPVGVKVDNGVLDFTTRQVLVACLPKDIPRAIKADVSGLALNQVLRVADLVLPAGVRTLTDGHLAVCAVHMPQVEKSPAEVAAETAAAEGAVAAPAAAEAEAKGKVEAKPKADAKGKADEKGGKADKGKEGGKK